MPGHRTKVGYHNESVYHNMFGHRTNLNNRIVAVSSLHPGHSKHPHLVGPPPYFIVPPYSIKTMKHEQVVVP